MSVQRNGDRLLFLDVLRGVAALAVVVEHGLAASVAGYLDFSVRYFDVGQFGVAVFLLCSGFIIPATLERGSLKRFWINRVFRLFPLYWATIAYFALYYQFVRPDAVYPPHGWQWLVNLTMLQEFVRVPHVTSVFWTLTLELLFYAACSMLQAFGLFRRTALLVTIGQAGLLLLGVVVPLIAQRRFPGGYAFLFLTMFVGTLFYRTTTGEASRRQLTVSLIALGLVAVPVSYVGFAVFPRNGYPFTYHCALAIWLSAYLTFAGLWAVRHRAMPASLCFLGRISYSLYLVHTCLVLTFPHSWPAIVYLPALLVGSVAVSSATYFLIEKPGIQVGRWLTRSREVVAPELRRAA